MKSRKVLILACILLLLTAAAAVIHFNTREEVPEHALRISINEDTHIVDIMELDYGKVSGTRMNGKGEEIPVDGDGIAMIDLLSSENITEFSKVTVIADDSYSAEVIADEIKEDGKVFLLLEEESLRLTVFGDENSKRSVSNVVQLVVE